MFAYEIKDEFNKYEKGKVMNITEQKQMEEFVAQSFDFARNNQIEPLTLMLDAGLNVNLSNEKGNSLLMLAAYNNSIDVAKLLLERGADVDKRNDRNQTPLAGVCFKGYTEMAQLLISYGADVDAQVGMGLTPLNCAIIFRHKDIKNILLKHSKKKPNFIQKLGIMLLGK